MDSCFIINFFDKKRPIGLYTHSTNVSVKHLMQQMQSRLIVKKEFVAIYGFKLVVSGLSARTRHVQQFPSTFSTLNTFEHVAVAAVQVAVESFVVGILQGVPFPQQV